MALIKKIQDLAAEIKDLDGCGLQPDFGEVDEIQLDNTYGKAWRTYHENDHLAANALTGELLIYRLLGRGSAYILDGQALADEKSIDEFWAVAQHWAFLFGLGGLELDREECDMIPWKLDDEDEDELVSGAAATLRNYMRYCKEEKGFETWTGKNLADLRRTLCDKREEFLSENTRVRRSYKFSGRRDDFEAEDTDQSHTEAGSPHESGASEDLHAGNESDHDTPPADVIIRDLVTGLQKTLEIAKEKWRTCHTEVAAANDEVTKSLNACDGTLIACHGVAAAEFKEAIRKHSHRESLDALMSALSKFSEEVTDEMAHLRDDLEGGKLAEEESKGASMSVTERAESHTHLEL